MAKTLHVHIDLDEAVAGGEKWWVQPTEVEQTLGSAELVQGNVSVWLSHQYRHT
jgi:hypothetical protein